MNMKPHSLGARKCMAHGGKVPGKGNGDTVPAMLTPGESCPRTRSGTSARMCWRR
jgi:hypothetical protein